MRSKIIIVIGDDIDIKDIEKRFSYSEIARSDLIFMKSINKKFKTYKNRYDINKNYSKSNMIKYIFS
jgi:hypothetical protein